MSTQGYSQCANECIESGFINLPDTGSCQVTERDQKFFVAMQKQFNYFKDWNADLLSSSLICPLILAH